MRDINQQFTNLNPALKDRVLLPRLGTAINLKETARQVIERQKRSQFLWIGELSDLLGEYEAHRQQYANLEAYSPRIVRFFSEYADKFVKEQEAPRP